MIFCKQCRVRTNICYFDLCEKCYAFSVFETHPPTASDVKLCLKGFAFEWPVGTKIERCAKCKFTKKYWKDFKGQFKFNYARHLNRNK